jgi:sugar lactone lactonase YvrE
MTDPGASGVRCVAAAAARLGEGPVWAARDRALYWVDIHGRRIHRYRPESGEQASWPTPLRVCSLAPCEQGGFVGGSERGFIAVDAALSRFDLIGDPEPHLPGNRCNDGKVDLRGRFWAGTMDDAEEQRCGALYRLDPDMGWSCMDSGYRVTNGPAFSPDGRYAYHSDSADRTVFRFAIEEPGGILRDKQVFARFGAADGHPDGMTTDAQGCLWIAFWDGWCVRRLSAGGEVIATIDLPVQRPTSCAFGGEGLRHLFITSARTGIADAQLADQPLAGGLFLFEPGVAGFPTPAFAPHAQGNPIRGQ